jgi:Flp pilus assembly protein TadG
MQTRSISTLHHPNTFLRRKKLESGNTIIEFTISLAVYLLLLFAILDFGRVLYTYHFVSNAARQATRWAAVNGATCSNDGSCDGAALMNNGPASAGDVQNYVKNTAPIGIDPVRITTTASWPDTPAGCGATANSPGCPVQVKVSYDFNFLFPNVYAGDITLSSTSQMVIAH